MMTANNPQNAQQLVREMIVSDVCELKMLLAGLERLVKSGSEHSDQRYRLLRRENEEMFKLLLAVVGEAKAQTELAYVREICALRERVAVIESKLETRAS